MSNIPEMIEQINDTNEMIRNNNELVRCQNEDRRILKDKERDKITAEIQAYPSVVQKVDEKLSGVDKTVQDKLSFIDNITEELTITDIDIEDVMKMVGDGSAN